MSTVSSLISRETHRIATTAAAGHACPFNTMKTATVQTASIKTLRRITVNAVRLIFIGPPVGQAAPAIPPPADGEVCVSDGRCRRVNQQAFSDLLSCPQAWTRCNPPFTRKCANIRASLSWAPTGCSNREHHQPPEHLEASRHMVSPLTSHENPNATSATASRTNTVPTGPKGTMNECTRISTRHRMIMKPHTR